MCVLTVVVLICHLKDELRMEEETVREARRIEANRKRLLKERQRIQKLLLPAGDIAVVEGEEGGGGAAGGAMSRSGSKSKGKPSIPGTVDPVLTLPTKNFPHRKAWNCAHARSSFIYQSVTQSARLAKRVEVRFSLFPLFKWKTRRILFLTLSLQTSLPSFLCR